MKSSKRIIGLLLLSFLLLGTYNAKSQSLLGSKMSEGFELFDPITNGTYLGNGDDPVFQMSMPFTFKYDNQTVTTLYIYGNGFISFNTYREPSALAIPKLYLYPNIVSWYAADLVTEDGFYYQVTGTAPFRVLTIEQRKARTFGNGGGATFDVQIKFYESSNQIKIIYGNTAGMGAANVFGWIYFTGSTASNYINVQPNDPNIPSTFHYSNSNPDVNRYIRDDAPFKIPKGRAYTLKVLPSLTKVNPDGKYILTKDYIYNDDINRPYVLISREASQQQVNLRYKIYGPVGDANAQTIYTAINDPNTPTDELVKLSPQPVGNAYRYNIAYAKGIAAGTNGALDLKTNQNLIKGGLYQVTAVLEIVGAPALNQTLNSYFYIALDYDLEATQINLPVLKEASTYKYGDHRVPLSLRVTNVGKYDINYFTIEAKIYNALNNSLVATKSAIWENLNQPLTRNNYVDVYLPDFNPPQVGTYYVTYTVTTDQYHPDTGTDNNLIPRAGSPAYYFAVNFETEIAETQILAPASSVYQNIPFRPGVKIVNNGAVDATNIAMTVSITKNNVVLYSKSYTIPSIPTGLANTVDFYFDDAFVPTETGNYAITFKANISGDEIPSNNTIAYAFNVVGGLSGDYTISATGSGPRNFPTIQDAVDAMYIRGVSGPTVFKFLDANYTVGYLGVTDKPAIDMTSKIPGMSATNTVTFKASEEISQRGYVKIHIQAGSGIGFMFGQSIAPNNLYAPINSTSNAGKKLFANNDGYITFDGGPLYTIQVIMESNNSKIRAPFYLGNGASNITLKNLIITDYTPLFVGQIPLISYTANALREFNYQADNLISAGVYMRSIAPYDVKTGGNTYGIDTLVNKNNVISGNYISGFGYGVVDLGIGILKKPLSDYIITFYNKNNTIEKNVMTNLGFAGVYMGFENNSKIERNRIDNVQNTSLGTAAGIYLGGKLAKNYFGYHNTDISINGNEISNIKSSTNIYGIFVDQTGFNFGTGQNTQFFPETDDNITIINNIVRDMNITSASTNQYGVVVMPSRNPLLLGNTLNKAPYLDYYYVKNVKISNNTIILDDQNEEFIQNNGEIAALGLAQVLNSQVINNAIAVKDQLITANNPLAAAVFYYNPMPVEANVIMNNNVFWIKQSTADLARFIETTMNMNIYENGSAHEFTRLDQWQAWTGQELNSVEIYNFINDLEIVTSTPNKLRAKSNPVPTGSVLDGRGLTLDYVPTDLDGNPRGYAGHRYDVGAEQFTGKPYVVDVEMLNYTQPLVYQATTGFPFDDAQYIMTKAPIEVKAQIRNNGTNMQSGIIATLNIYRESNNNRFDDGKIVLTTSKKVDNLMPGEIREITFDLADGVEPDFVPKAYSSFNGTADAYTNIPTPFVKMIGNVTPRYKIVINTNYDENNWNNSVEETVRFYLLRSKLNMLISTENWQTLDYDNLPTDANIVAANLNLDSLVSGLFKLGWYRNLDLEDPRIDYDIFDRKNWERRSVDYSLYKTLFWVDGHDTYINGGVPTTNSLNVYEYNQVINYLNSGNESQTKKNFFISSQDFVRNNETIYPTFDSYFHAGIADPNTPLKGTANYSGHSVNGTYVGRLQIFDVVETYLENLKALQYPNSYPMPGLFTAIESGIGVARVGMLYDTVWFDNRVYSSIIAVPESMKIACVTTSAVPYNLCLVGVDWRHWGNIEKVLRTMVDYAEANDGNIVPIDLLSFEAIPSNNRVDISWTTSSEINSSRFDIERSNLTNGIADGFVKIGEENARGTSASITHYGPFVDNKVNYGNTYAYRLKMIDKNGEFKYSEEKYVTVLGENGNIAISEIEPNPVSSSSNVNIYLTNSNNVNISIYDMAGTLIRTLQNGIMNSGNNQISINAADFNSGAYNVVITIGNESFVKKLNIVK